MSQIQIIGLRDYVKADGTKSKREAFFEHQYRLSSLEDIFATSKHLEIIKKIPENERYNLYFTVANCIGKRELAEQWAIPFDVDGVEGPFLASKEDLGKSALKAFTRVMRKFYNPAFDGSGVGILWSGHGIQLFYMLDAPITDDKFFNVYRESYKDFCKFFEKELETVHIKGRLDASVFSAGRLMRLPDTVNRKPNKPEAEAILLNLFIPAKNPNFLKPKPEDQKNYTAISSMKFQVDDEGVQEECEFLQFAKINQEKITEPEWYAMLGIVGWLDDGDNLAHLYSNKHPSYSEEETNVKLRQARANSGPRTCASVNSLWGKCHECKHFGNVKTPLHIISDNFIRSEKNGFREIKVSKDGTVRTGKPAYDDLMKAFSREFNFRSIIHTQGSEIIVYTPNVGWKSMLKPMIKSWMYNKVKEPTPSSQEMNEFISRIEISNVAEKDFLDAWRGKYIAFKNCVLDLRTQDVLAMNPDMGITEVVDTVYDKHIKAPKWEKFLHDVAKGNKEKMNILEEFAAYAMMGTTNEFQVALVLQGDGSNGKSVYLNTISKVFGSSNCTSIPLKDLDKDFRAIELRGKFLNISSETSFNALADSSTFKALISGDSITSNVKYGPLVSFNPTVKIAISCNNPPQIRDSSFGLSRRLLIVKFNRLFLETDPDFNRNIEQDLLEEAAGIINRLLTAYHRLKIRNGFYISSVIKEEKEEFIKSANYLHEFVSENIIPAEGNFLTVNAIANLIDSFTELRNNGNRVQPRHVYSIIETKFRVTKIKTRINGKGNPVYGYPNIDIDPNSELLPSKNF